VPPSGTTCLFTSHLRRHSRFSDNDSRPFCFPVPTKTLSYDSCVTITIHHYTVWTPVMLAIINIILTTLKMFMIWWWWWRWLIRIYFVTPTDGTKTAEHHHRKPSTSCIFKTEAWTKDNLVTMAITSSLNVIFLRHVQLTPSTLHPWHFYVEHCIAQISESVSDITLFNASSDVTLACDGQWIAR